MHAYNKTLKIERFFYDYFLKSQKQLNLHNILPQKWHFGSFFMLFLSVLEYNIN